MFWRGMLPAATPSEKCTSCHPDEKTRPATPGALRRTLNYLGSLAEHIAGGSVEVDDIEHARRRRRCNKCPMRIAEADMCSLCGCPLHKTAIGDKLRWGISRCFGWEHHGVALGVYNLPKLTEIQILAIGDMCGPVPILICDDTKPGTDKQKEIASLARKYPNVEYWGNPENYGHHRGDATVFWKALQWGNIKELESVCKLSQRMLIMRPNWIQEAHTGLMASGEATGAANCIDNNTRLFIRSECVMLNVRRWIDSGAYHDLQGRNSYAPVVELHYNHIMCKHFGVMPWTDEKGNGEIGKRWLWNIIPERRFQKADGVIWHCTDTVEEYQRIAARYAAPLDEDFHVMGSEQRTGYTRNYSIG